MIHVSEFSSEILILLCKIMAKISVLAALWWILVNVDLFWLG